GVRNPHATLDCPALLAAACAHAGDRARATVYLRQFLAEFQERVLIGREPEAGEPLRWLPHVNPCRRAEVVERITSGRRTAGLRARAGPCCRSRCGTSGRRPVPLRRIDVDVVVRRPRRHALRREGASRSRCAPRQARRGTPLPGTRWTSGGARRTARRARRAG